MVTLVHSPPPFPAYGISVLNGPPWFAAYVARARIRIEGKQPASALSDLTAAIKIQSDYVMGEIEGGGICWIYHFIYLTHWSSDHIPGPNLPLPS